MANMERLGVNGTTLRQVNHGRMTILGHQHRDGVQAEKVSNVQMRLGADMLHEAEIAADEFVPDWGDDDIDDKYDDVDLPVGHDQPAHIGTFTPTQIPLNCGFSFCTCCLGRGWQLQIALPINLALTEQYKDSVRFCVALFKPPEEALKPGVVIDGASPEMLEHLKDDYLATKDFILENFQEELRTGRLVVSVSKAKCTADSLRRIRRMILTRAIGHPDEKWGWTVISYCRGGNHRSVAYGELLRMAVSGHNFLDLKKYDVINTTEMAGSWEWKKCNRCDACSHRKLTSDQQKMLKEAEERVRGVLSNVLQSSAHSAGLQLTLSCKAQQRSDN
eukprot:s1640_g4.t1